MAFLKSTFIIFGLIAAVMAQQQRQRQQCNIEECLLKLRDPDPAREGDLKIFCARTAEGLACLDRCFNSPLYHAPNQIIMGGVKKLLSEICAPGSGLGKRYLQESKCLNQQHITVMDCATSMIEKYPAVLQHPDPESNIRVFCCSIDKTEECIIERVHKDCGSSVKLVHEMMSKAFHPIRSFICYTPVPSVLGVASHEPITLFPSYVKNYMPPFICSHIQKANPRK